MRSRFTRARARGREGTIGASPRREPSAGFVAVGVYFYAWDDDAGALASWARELVGAERGELAHSPGPKRGKEGPCHSAHFAIQGSEL